MHSLQNRPKPKVPRNLNTANLRTAKLRTKKVEQNMQTPVKTDSYPIGLENPGVCDTERIIHFPKFKPKLKLKADIDSQILVINSINKDDS